VARVGVSAAANFFGAGLLTGLKENSALLREALQALIERENARKLVAAGGSLSPARSSRPSSRLRPVEFATDDFG